MNIALVAAFATGMVMYKKDNSKTSSLGAMIVAGSIVAAATKGV